MNLTPDKQHTAVVNHHAADEEGACLDYAHGFNLVEEGMQIRKDLTVVMSAPSAPAPRCARNTSAALVCPH